MFASLVVVAVLTPFEVAFLASPFEMPLASLDGVALARFWLNRAIDGLFLADMVLQFFVMYPVPNRNARSMTYVRDLRLIARRYLTGWFLVDLVSIFPFDVLGTVYESMVLEKLRLLQVVRLLRLLRLARLVQSMRLLRRWQLEMSLSYRRMTQWQLLFIVCVGAHWISCILGLMGSAWDAPCGHQEGPVDCKESWFTSMMDTTGEELEELGPFGSYLVSLHVAASILVHPHAGKPTNSLERACFIVLIFIGGFIWTRVISRTTAMQTSLDRHSIVYKQTMDDLNSNSKALGLTPELRRRLRGFFIASRDDLRDSSWHELTSRMSPALQADVACELHRAWLRRIPYLSGASKVFILHLAPKIRRETFAQNELFGENFKLYILRQGLCGMGADNAKPGVLRVLQPGAVWGMEHLLLTKWYLLRPNTARALSFLQVMSLTREDFGQVCKDHPENRETLRRYFVRYAVTRGIIVYAQQRRERALQTHSPSLVSHESHGAEQYNHHVRRARHELTRKLEWKGHVNTLEAGEDDDDLDFQQRIPSLLRGCGSPGRLTPRTGAAAAVPPILLGRQRSRSVCPQYSRHSSQTAMMHLPSIMEPKATPPGLDDDGGELLEAPPPSPRRRMAESSELNVYNLHA
jgi:CRP-like cAMP-binding protein